MYVNIVVAFKDGTKSTFGDVHSSNVPYFMSKMVSSGQTVDKPVKYFIVEIPYE